ncbi:MAG: MaoC family dehydratase N-terminal domain-containing protein [Sphingomonadales bacterium]|nr:MaoC family dehydratase N-terminal domain-containing protein [Sphingomonadales bacterium]
MAERTLDCSDLDRIMGKPLTPWSLKEDLHNNDFRRWVQAMHYPNLLHYDADYAAVGRWGRLVAPQSFTISAGEGHGACPAGIGSIPNSHLVFGGDEWWFYGPRLFAGDRVIHEKIPFDYVVKETKFAGPTCFQRGDNNYYKQDGTLFAKQRSTAIRYNPEYAVEMASMGSDADEPAWSDDELAEIEERKLEYIRAMQELGHGRRHWNEQQVGGKLPVRVFGPHSIASLATEWRAYMMTIWGSAHRNRDCDPDVLGYVGPMAGWEMDPVEERFNPENTDGAYIGPSRGHMFKRWANYIGMPREYGYGASMGAWVLDYLAGWAGEWGQVVHCNAQYRGPAFVGDITIMTGEIVDKLVDDEGRNVVQVKVLMANQQGTTLATATAEVELPL